jgi:hypothetical protein
MSLHLEFRRDGGQAWAVAPGDLDLPRGRPIELQVRLCGTGSFSASDLVLESGGETAVAVRWDYLLITKDGGEQPVSVKVEPQWFLPRRVHVRLVSRAPHQVLAESTIIGISASTRFAAAALPLLAAGAAAANHRSALAAAWGSDKAAVLATAVAAAGAGGIAFRWATRLRALRQIDLPILALSLALFLAGLVIPSRIFVLVKDRDCDEKSCPQHVVLRDTSALHLDDPARYCFSGSVWAIPDRGLACPGASGSAAPGWLGSKEWFHLPELATQCRVLQRWMEAKLPECRPPVLRVDDFLKEVLHVQGVKGPASLTADHLPTDEELRHIPPVVEVHCEGKLPDDRRFDVPLPFLSNALELTVDSCDGLRLPVATREARIQSRFLTGKAAATLICDAPAQSVHVRFSAGVSPGIYHFRGSRFEVAGGEEPDRIASCGDEPSFVSVEPAGSTDMLLAPWMLTEPDKAHASQRGAKTIEVRELRVGAGRQVQVVKCPPKAGKLVSARLIDTNAYDESRDVRWNAAEYGGLFWMCVEEVTPASGTYLHQSRTMREPCVASYERRGDRFTVLRKTSCPGGPGSYEYVCGCG